MGSLELSLGDELLPDEGMEGDVGKPDCGRDGDEDMQLSGRPIASMTILAW